MRRRDFLQLGLGGALGLGMGEMQCFGREVFAFCDLVHALAGRHVDARVPLGRLSVITGVSGSGKSTLARMIVGLMEPTSGCITFDGTDVGEMRRQRRFQMIFQDPFSSLNPRHRASTIVSPLSSRTGPARFSSV